MLASKLHGHACAGEHGPLPKPKRKGQMAKVEGLLFDGLRVKC